MPYVEISCCMIVKDEEKHIKGCIDSLIREVDEIVVVDTGSRDNTVKIAKSFDNNVRVFHHEWKNDFAEARNVSLSLARGEWILYMDADERLNTLGRKNLLRCLAKMPNGADAYNVAIRNFGLESQSDRTIAHIGYAARFFRKIPGIAFEGSVHEQITPFLKRAGAHIQTAPFIIDHFGYHLDDQARLRKLRRNLAISLKEVKNNPYDVYAIYYLALTYFLMGESMAAWRYIDRAYHFMHEGVEQQIRCSTYNLRAKLLISRKQYYEAILMADMSLKEVPDQNAAHFLKGLALYGMKKPMEAIPHFEESLLYHQSAGNLLKHRSRISHEFATSVFTVKKLLANCYVETGQFDRALDLMEEEIHEHPMDLELLNFCAMCAFMAGKTTKAKYYMTRTIECGESMKLAVPNLTPLHRIQKHPNE